MANLLGFWSWVELGLLHTFCWISCRVICLGAYYIFNLTYKTIQLVSFAGAVIGIMAYTHVTVSEKERRRMEKKLSFDREHFILPLIQKNERTHERNDENKLNERV